MRILTTDEINELVDDLRGTCKSIEQALADLTNDEIDDMSAVANEMEMCDAIDKAIFLCNGCGWWCEVGDYAENQNDCSGDICSDCEDEE